MRQVRAAPTRSFLGEDVHFPYAKVRNEAEARAWCAALDAMLATPGITGNHRAVEIAVRRLIAVREADRTNSWRAAAALDVWSPGVQFGTVEQRRRLRRDVAAIRSERGDDAGRTRRGGRTAVKASSSSGGGKSAAKGRGDSRGGSGRGAGGPPRGA